MEEPILKLEISLPAKYAGEATDFLAKFAQFPPQMQEIGLAFLQGILFAQRIRPNA